MGGAELNAIPADNGAALGSVSIAQGKIETGMLDLRCIVCV